MEFFTKDIIYAYTTHKSLITNNLNTVIIYKQKIQYTNKQHLIKIMPDGIIILTNCSFFYVDLIFEWKINKGILL